MHDTPDTHEHEHTHEHGSAHRPGHSHAHHGHSHGHGHGHGHSHEHGHEHSHGIWPFGHSHDHGPVDPDLAESREGVRVLLISLTLLGITAIAQAIIVVLTGSVALLADTVHNVGDALTAVPLALAFVLSRRPPSARFAWGLGRTEDLAGLIIVVLIAFSGAFAFYQSVDRLLHPYTPTHLAAGIAAGFVGFVGNELVAGYRIRQGKRMASAALIADGQHARIDGFTSLSVALGLILVAGGFPIADPLIGIAISIVIARITWNTAKQVGVRLLDGIETEHMVEVRGVIEEELPDGALQGLRGRWFGHVIHLDVQVDTAAIAPSRLHGLGDELLAALRGAGTRVRAVDVVASTASSNHPATAESS